MRSWLPILALVACKTVPELELVDADGDGFHEAEDCDDQDPDKHPTAPEQCDDTDLDCDGIPGVDDADSVLAHQDGFIDHDQDGYGSEAILSCPQHQVADGGDCDDNDASRNPGAAEVCNGIDEDCDGEVDDGVTLELFEDTDGDGWGGAAITTCELAPGLVTTGGDCADGDAEVHPFASEWCDGVDNDCDGLFDGADSALDAVAGFVDADDDGVGSETAVLGCVGEAGFAEISGDCDDLDPLRTPGADEICDGIDNDCDFHPDRADTAFEGTPLGCDQCPEFTAAPLLIEHVNPCLLDSDATFGCHDGTILTDTHMFGRRIHRAARRTDSDVFRDQLLLYLPPGGALHSNELPQWLAELGYRVVTLDWYASPIDPSLHCMNEADLPACFDALMEEVVFGGDPSPAIDLAPGNHITRELAHMLTHLGQVDPSGGWEAFLDASSTVIWEDVQLLAWSKGASPAGMLSQQEVVAGWTALGPRIFEDRLLYDRPWATPGDRFRMVGHIDEWTEFQSEIENIVGPATGADFTDALDLDTSPWPWPSSTAGFTTASGITATGCVPHAFVANDSCMDVDILRPLYRNLFCSY